MSHFEYVSVAVSIVYSLVLARVLGALPEVLNRRKRYWVHSTWAFTLLGLVAFNWYVWWALRDVSFTPLAFVLVLAAPSLIYLRAAILLPADPGRVTSWREKYYGSRVGFFALAVLAPVNGILVWFVTGLAKSPSDVVAPGAAAAFMAIGMVTAS